MRRSYITVDAPAPRPLFGRPISVPGAAPIAAIVLLLAAISLRHGQYGNPIAGLDEQLYLLVGDRMWHGELPYRDIWDRKPFGLFLLFAAIRAIPGDPFLVAQLVATAFAAATAWLIARMAAPANGWPAATMAGLFYLAGQIELWGDTVQSPVFYNLPIVAAAMLTWQASRAPLAVGARRQMIAAMLLAGVAVQIKTNALIEGAFFAGWYCWCRWRVDRDGRRTITAAATLAIVGTLPTLAVIAFYGSIGALSAWWQANVLSIIAKGRPQDTAVAPMLAETAILIAPILLFAGFGLWRRTRRFAAWDAGTTFLTGWIIVALIDFAAIGGYYPHYAMPLLLAASVLAAHGFAYGRIGCGLWAVSMLWPLIHTQIYMPHSGAEDRAIAQRVQAALPADVRTRCLFIFEGPVAYYQLTDACRVSRYAFSAHISSRREAAALGEAPQIALDAAMARRPGTVITVAAPPRPDRNDAIEQRLLGVLHRDYRVTARLPHRFFTTDETLIVWRRVTP